jgi:hypothetical protein
MAKVVPVDPAVKAKTSSCLRGLVVAYDPSIRIIPLGFLFDEEGSLEQTFSA